MAPKMATIYIFQYLSAVLAIDNLYFIGLEQLYNMSLVEYKCYNFHKYLFTFVDLVEATLV